MIDIAPTYEHLLKSGLAALRKEGFRARLNVRGCCRSCISAAWGNDPKEAKKSGLWHYGGQGCSISWVDGRPFYTSAVRRSDRQYRRWSYEEPEKGKVDTILFNHDGSAEERARMVEVLRDIGLVVDWNGTDWQCIGVTGTIFDAPA